MLKTEYRTCTACNLVVKNKGGGGLNNFLPLKRGANLRGGRRLNSRIYGIDHVSCQFSLVLSVGRTVTPKLACPATAGAVSV